MHGYARTSSPRRGPPRSDSLRGRAWTAVPVDGSVDSCCYQHDDTAGTRRPEHLHPQVVTIAPNHPLNLRSSSHGYAAGGGRGALSMRAGRLVEPRSCNHRTAEGTPAAMTQSGSKTARTTQKPQC